LAAAAAPQRKRITQNVSENKLSKYTNHKQTQWSLHREKLRKLFSELRLKNQLPKDQIEYFFYLSQIII